MKKSKEEIIAAKKETTDQIRKVKLTVSSRKFSKRSIYYDCKANPLNHLKVYYRLSNI
ncbi:hypothetical protein BDF14DRAFT_1856315 [Spinellus fusiger]|nr:hypothetical protein BDF14DRAFT_1856315 [Spinellus fusiger]